MMDAHDFLDVARELAQGTTAAHRRSAISRAYYAVYHVAFELLHALGFRLPRDHRGHELVWQYLFSSGVDPTIHAGAQLRRLQSLRVTADYQLRDPHPEAAAVVAHWIARAEQLIRVLDAASADSATCARMTVAIQAWERGRSTGTR